MTLLEAISPTARALLAETKILPPPRKMEPVMNITKSGRRRMYRVHVSMDGRPACGGGCGARTAQWQEVLLEADCRRCRGILRMAEVNKK